MYFTIQTCKTYIDFSFMSQTPIGMVLILNIQFRSILFVPKNYKIAAFQIKYGNVVHDKRKKNKIGE